MGDLVDYAVELVNEGYGVEIELRNRRIIDVSVSSWTASPLWFLDGHNTRLYPSCEAEASEGRLVIKLFGGAYRRIMIAIPEGDILLVEPLYAEPRGASR